MIPKKVERIFEANKFYMEYSHEDLLPGELSQQRVLAKSNIPTHEQMIQVDKEAKRQKADTKRSKSITKRKMLPRIDD
jgi:xanthine dehydrogenase iron-sulfur cluster and FAD-binding subunit A